MITGDWGNPKRIWGLEETYDAGRMIQIYEAIRDLPITSIIDVACGTGIIADGLAWTRKWDVYQFDIEQYPEWKHLDVIPVKMDVMDFIKIDKSYDLVMFLNAYRNWDEKPRSMFDEWLKRNAKYFITSDGKGEAIGKDVKGHTLTLEKL